MTETGHELLARVIKVTEGVYEGAVGYITRYVTKEESDMEEGAYYEAMVTHGSKLAWIGVFPHEFTVQSKAPLPAPWGPRNN